MIIWGEYYKLFLRSSNRHTFSVFLFVISFIPFTRGAAPAGEDDLVSMSKERSDELKDCLGTIVLPIGSLSVGICRHRALLFKVC